MLRASVAVELAGVPTASLVCEGFLGQAATTSSGLGMPNLPLAKVPGHVDVQTADELRDNVLAVTLDAVINNLTQEPAQALAIQAVDEPSVVPQPVVEDLFVPPTLEQPLRNGWTRGLGVGETGWDEEKTE